MRAVRHWRDAVVRCPVFRSSPYQGGSTQFVERLSERFVERVTCPWCLPRALTILAEKWSSEELGDAIIEAYRLLVAG